MLQPLRTSSMLGTKVLTVDDNQKNLKLLRHILTGAGCEVLDASSAVEAREHLAKSLPEIVLLDVLMPETDGYALCREIKSRPETAHIPVIFLSALSEPLDKVKAFDAGGADYVSKPFDATEVLLRVKHHLDMVRMQQSLEKEKAQLERANEELSRAREQTTQVFSLLADQLCGKVLDNKYRLEEKIGVGGYAVVYRATHLGLDRPVAVKVLKPGEAVSDAARLQRFEQEGIAASRIKHPSVITIYHMGTSSDGITYMVMELLDGCPLFDQMKPSQPLTLGRCLQVIVPVLEVLMEAHAIGIVHRDIKPENIFLQRIASSEVVKVLDFGIAALIGADKIRQTRLTAEGQFVGSVLYTAPESIHGVLFDGRTDIYSVGVMLYEMLCGQVPFAAEGKQLLGVLSKHLKTPPPPLRQVNPKVSPAIAELVHATLAKDPAQRPTARELLSSLLTVANSLLGTNEVERLLNRIAL